MVVARLLKYSSGSRMQEGQGASDLLVALLDDKAFGLSKKGSVTIMQMKGKGSVKCCFR